VNREQNLVTRWNTDRPVDLDSPPFGLTEEGYKDFRGLPFSKLTALYGKAFVKCDLGGADFSRTRIERKEFVDCRFARVKFDLSVEQQSSFYGCVFSNCSFRKTTLGVGTSNYDDCRFVENLFSEPNIDNAVFRRTEFTNNDMRNFFFNATGFWSCAIQGKMESVEFLGSYQTAADVVRYGPPVYTGLHDVDLSNAVLRMVSFRSHCAFENVVLPRDGSSKFVDANAFSVQTSEFKRRFPEHAGEIDNYLKIFVSPGDQPTTVCNLSDLCEVIGDAEVGLYIFREIK
jgi:uncharacterized protein YjbI with pentapeptide repeats